MTQTIKRKPITYSGTGSAIDNYFSSNPSDGKNWASFDKNNAQHMHILSLARQAGWTTEHPIHRKIADLESIDKFLRSERCPVRKPLLEQTTNELSKVITAFNGIVQSKFK
ncbi:MAG: hypothetical protein JST78_09680 [Bacteroidetes bacterium]|nr:hypothetical protein [Bacteroidota bacterium]